jgi:hypothetical protein
MQGLDLSHDLKKAVPVSKIGELYHSVRYVHGTNTFSIDKGDEIRQNVLAIASILGNAADQIAEPQENGGTILKPVSVEIWREIEKDYDVTKRIFGKKINFVAERYKKEAIFRDVEHAYILSNHGFNKPAVILAGGVIEELLRLYLKHKNIQAMNATFDEYIKACVTNRLLKSAINKLSDSVRHFRNIVHLSKETSSKISISKATAKGAVSSIFTIANDF